MWTGTVYMGRYSPMDVVFDTGSDWLVIKSILCDKEYCEGDTYDLANSIQVGYELSDRIYGSAAIIGYEYTDVVCLELTACVEDFEFFAI